MEGQEELAYGHGAVRQNLEDGWRRLCGQNLQVSTEFRYGGFRLWRVALAFPDTGMSTWRAGGSFRGAAWCRTLLRTRRTGCMHVCV